MGRVLVFPSPAERARHQARTASKESPRISRVETAPDPVWVRDLAHARALQDSPDGVAAFNLLVTHERDLARRLAVLNP